MREQSDPIENARKALLDGGVAAAELKTVDDAVKATVQDAADFAQASPEPPEAELWTDILVEAGGAR
jgi:pyruvate dehydrogenase E1 component alpha subunit